MQKEEGTKGKGRGGGDKVRKQIKYHLRDRSGKKKDYYSDLIRKYIYNIMKKTLMSTNEIKKGKHHRRIIIKKGKKRKKIAGREIRTRLCLLPRPRGRLL